MIIEITRKGENGFADGMVSCFVCGRKIPVQIESNPGFLGVGELAVWPLSVDGGVPVMMVICPGCVRNSSRNPINNEESRR